MKTGYQLTFFTLQSRRHNNKSMSDWLVTKAQNAGVHGVTVTHASKGFGHDGIWHAASFFELADQPLEIIIIADEEACNALFASLKAEKPNLFYTKTAIEYGTL